MKQIRINPPRFSKIWMAIIAILILIITCLLYGYYIYSTAMKNKENQFDESKSYVLSEGYLKKIDQAESFHELDSYHIFFGESNEGEDSIAFLPLSSDEDAIILKQDDIIDKSEAKESIEKNCSNCSKIDVKPAMINDRPLWEITYFDERNRYNMDYISMLDGSLYERLQLKQTFK